MGKVFHSLDLLLGGKRECHDRHCGKGAVCHRGHSEKIITLIKPKGCSEGKEEEENVKGTMC